jgi:hypothetical protein
MDSSYTTETMGYNVNGQLTSLNWTGLGGIQYNYSATQNNGQITQTVDTISGETISYLYDSLKRLTSATSLGCGGGGCGYPLWRQDFQYDGFGNMTGKALNGTAGPIPVDAATNRLSTVNYDGNGNMTSGLSATFSYDEANRISSAVAISGGAEYYGYAADNKRIYRRQAGGFPEWTFYGIRGEKLGTYSLSTFPVPDSGQSTYSFYFVATKGLLNNNLYKT